MKILTPVAVFSDVSVPEDGVDRRTAASVETPLQALANRDAHTASALAAYITARKWGLVKVGDTGPGRNTTVAGSEAYALGSDDGVYYRVQFANPMPNANYVVHFTVEQADAFVLCSVKTKHASYFKFSAAAINGAAPSAFPPNSVELVVGFTVVG